jgi:superoxide reductase
MKVYQCENCKKTMITKDEVKLEGWVELIPCSTDAAQEKHVPVVTKKCKQVKVDVGSVVHPMSEEHFIEWVAIETAQGYQVKYLKAGDLPVCSFSLADGDTFVKAYAYCNLHGLWAD